MSIVTGAAGAEGRRAVDPGSERARLSDAMKQLEGVFVQQLFKAMRETVPDEGLVSGGSGEEIFTSLLDERLASLVPEAWGGGHDGIEAALLRQFRGALSDAGAGAEAPSPTIPETGA